MTNEENRRLLEACEHVINTHKEVQGVMKVNFDNMRKKMAKVFNDAVINFNRGEYRWVENDLNDLRTYVRSLCCIYDDSGNFPDLGDIELLEAKFESDIE